MNLIFITIRSDIKSEDKKYTGWTKKKCVLKKRKSAMVGGY